MAIPTAGEITTLIPGGETTILIAAFVGAVAYLIYDNLDRGAFKSYDKEPLDRKVMKDLKFRLKKVGKRGGQEIIQDRDKVGDVLYWDKYSIREDGVIHPVSELGESDRDDIGDCYILMTGPQPDGIIGKFQFVWWLFSNYLYKDGRAEIYILNEESVKKTRDAFVIDREVQFLPRTYTGVNSKIMVQDTVRSTNVVNQIATADFEGELINSMSEFLSKVEHFEIEHLKKMNEMDKEAEMERARQEGLID